METLDELQRYSQLLLRLYRMAQELPITDFQDAALDLVKGVLPFDSSLWGTAAPSQVGADIHTVHLHNKSPDMLPAYESVKHLDTAVGGMFSQPRATRGFNLDRWFGEPGQREIRDFLRRFEIENMLATTVIDPSTRFAHWILLYRADRDADYTPAEIARLELLAPHVMEALAINRKMHLERLSPVEPGAVSRGSAIADLRGVVYHADARFAALAGEEWDDWHERRLPAALSAHFQQDGERFLGRALVVDARLEQQLLFLKARPRCRADGLTAREFTIAKLIAKGDTHKEIAQTLTRSPATVRNQIQAIYEKLEVGNIAGLIEELRLAD
ncbi:LuxR C-terminal-related transcriptional regulator [Variovorax sp. M-6]|uniref:helix-turn-helix transcriptional regulator n=1 Tax=Variovorax sp. M-6 TaxID=3233041 RepID=UPI003F994462